MKSLLEMLKCYWKQARPFRICKCLKTSLEIKPYLPQIH